MKYNPLAGVSKVLLEHKEILYSLVNKNLQAKYAGSGLGMLWAFIHPLLLAMTISFVFTDIFRMNVSNFYLFIISGILPWSFFSGSIQESAMSIPCNAAVLKQFSFPRSFIPVSYVMANFILLLFSLAVVLPLFVWVDPGVVLYFPLLLIALLFLLVFTLGLALMVSALCVQMRDVNQALVSLFMLWMWFTPIFYSPDMVPADFRIWFELNPFTSFIRLFRMALFTPGVVDIPSIVFTLGLALLSGVAGYMVFARREGGFLKHI